MTRPLSRLRPSSDDDPTSVQRILATLPDPGPMPPQLVDRISASLAAERERLTDSPAKVTPLAPPTIGGPRPAVDRSDRSDRSGSRGFLLCLSGAAAAAAIGGVVVINSIGPSADQAPSAQAQFYVGTAAGNGSPAPGPSGTQEAAGSNAPRVDPHIQVTSTQYTSAQLADQASRLWASPQRELRTLGAEAPSIGPIGTQLGAQECLAAIGEADATRALVDLAFFDGSPAAVVVTEGDGNREVRVVTRQCGPASNAMLAGPITLR